MPQSFGLPAGTVTFLFTDIEGSTRLWEQNPDAMRSALGRHDRILREAISASHGYVFKTVGDAFCAAFATAPEALQAALSGQQAIQTEAWGEGGSLRVRMALHTGTAEERDGDYFGQPLNRVARLMAAAHGGQTLLSLAAQELVRDQLPALVALRDLGEARLKDLGRSERVFQLLHPELPSEYPPLRTLETIPNNLPQQLTSFIGREKEVREIKDLLMKVRLLTLAGTGGAGKSRLSLQVAADLLEGCRDGVWLVELAPLSDPALVVQTVADVLGISAEAGISLQRTLIDALKSKQMLLVLDNTEHLIAACAALAADILRVCPGIRILASSREPLNIAGEAVYRLPSLSLPDPQKAPTPESVSQYEAVRLFIERAQAVQPAFVVTNENAPAVAQVCVHLDGIPLAIELAAARLRSLSVEEVNARLSQRFRLLTGGARTLLPRQQTLRALIDWSYDLLTGREKVLLRRLSVFSGGWTLSAAEAVCVLPAADELLDEPAEEAGNNSIDAAADWDVLDWDVLDLMTSLADKSLVVAETQAGSTRYRLLETIRQYAGERLQQAGEKEAVGRQHLDWFFTLARDAEMQLEGPDLGVWLARLSADLDNLRAALDFGMARAEPDQALAIRMVQMVAALRGLWRAKVLLREGHAYAVAALAANAEARRSEETRQRLCVLALLHSYNNDHAPACLLMDEHLAWCRRRNDAVGVIHTLSNYVTVLFRKEDFAGARRLNEECLTEILLASEAGEADAATLSRYRIAAEGNLAVMFWDEGDYGRAFALMSKNIPLFREQNNLHWLALTLMNAGALLTKPWEGRDLVQAEQYLREALTLSAQHEHRLEMVDSISYFAFLRAAQSNWVRAGTLSGAADSLKKAMGMALSGTEEEEFAALIAECRTFLEPGSFADAWAAGQALTLDDASKYALENVSDENASQ